MYFLTMTATVLTPDPTSGDYSIVALSGLPCRLTLVPPEDGKDASDRAELASMRRLLWGPGTVIPENARVVVNNETWAMVNGSFAVVTGLGGAEVYRRAELVRAL